jgi:hypothetical protein
MLRPPARSPQPHRPKVESDLAKILRDAQLTLGNCAHHHAQGRDFFRAFLPLIICFR